ncbi:HEPACAM family member 2-like isoform X2 [Branchiostoma lanceolatum]|uniref:HEPACAM family member 2-like isoform X2 n=1 Tax=Branchiostoma lanceolatum TaxID=7740 RepID=UPI003453A9B2
MSVLLSPCVIGLMSSVFLSISRVSTRALSRIYRRINACRCGGNSPSFTVIVIGTSIRLVPADTDMAILGLHLLFLIFRVVCSNKGLPISTSVRGTRGEVVTLPASYDHDQPVIALTWNKFDPNIQGTRIPVYMYSPNSNSSLPLGPFKHRATLNNNGSLTLRHLQKKDEGQYVMTTLIDAVGQQEHYVYLEVQIPPKVSVGQQSPLRVPVNMNITLNCTMEKSTNLQYNIYWLRNGVRPPPDWHVEYEDQNSYKSSLFITRLTREDAGNYTCVAQHGGSSQSDSLSLDVQYPAVITNISVPTMAFVGTTASLWCQADGNPAPEIRWYRPATNSSPIHTTDQWKSSSRLTLRELDMLDDGQYVCAATNRMGQWDRRYVHLTVLGVASPPTAVIETATQPGSWADFSMIVGGAAGGAAVLLLIMLAWFVWSRRMKAKAGYGNQSLLILQGQSCYPENNAMIMVSEEGKTLSVKSFTGSEKKDFFLAQERPPIPDSLQAKIAADRSSWTSDNAASGTCPPTAVRSTECVEEDREKAGIGQECHAEEIQLP